MSRDPREIAAAGPYQLVSPEVAKHFGLKNGDPFPYFGGVPVIVVPYLEVNKMRRNVVVRARVQVAIAREMAREQEVW